MTQFDVKLICVGHFVPKKLRGKSNQVHFTSMGSFKQIFFHFPNNTS